MLKGNDESVQPLAAEKGCIEMPRGRRPVPAGVQLAKGNPRKRSMRALQRAASEAAADVEQANSVEGSEPPLPLSAREREIWDRMHDLLATRRTLMQTDFISLARYARYCCVWIDASASLVDRRAKSGMRMIYKTPGGREYIRPAYRIMLDAEAKMLAIEREFGLTPASRTAVVQRLASVKTEKLGLPSPDSAPAQNVETRSPIGILRSTH